MLASSFLDTAIGIIFVFLLLSIIATTINEVILSLVNMRGRMLLDGIKNLLNDPKAEGMVKQIYNHGAVYGLYRGEFNPSQGWRQEWLRLQRLVPGKKLDPNDAKPHPAGQAWTNGDLPAYIPSGSFALAFLGILPQTAQAAAARAQLQASLATTKSDQAKDALQVAQTALQQAQQALDSAPDADKQQLKNKVDLANKSVEVAQTAATDAEKEMSDVQQRAADAKNAASTAQTSLDAARSAPPGVTPEERAKQLASAFEGLKAVARALSDIPETEKVGKPLLTLLETANNDFQTFSQSIEAWYNSAMDRVSGWYKYHTQKMLFGIGLVLAIALNANTINIIKQVSTNDTLRQSLVAAAADLSKQKSGETQPASTTGGTGPGQAAPPTSQTSANGQSSAASLPDQMQKIASGVSKVEGLGLPLGWNANNVANGWWPIYCSNDQWLCVGKSKFSGISPENLVGWRIFGGWILTAFAVSLGAPFWFDLLNKFMVVRSTIKPQEKSQPEASKD